VKDSKIQTIYSLSKRVVELPDYDSLFFYQIDKHQNNIIRHLFMNEPLAADDTGLVSHDMTKTKNGEEKQKKQSEDENSPSKAVTLFMTHRRAVLIDGGGIETYRI
jgi:hypothetical protein